jgi:hypothetical protein
MFGSHPLESDGVNPHFFAALAREDKKTLKSCRVNIPPTVLFEQGFAKAVFTTASSSSHDEAAKHKHSSQMQRNETGASTSVSDIEAGEVKRKAGRDFDAQDIWDMMSHGCQEGDVCAVLMYAADRSNDLSSVRFLDRAGLKSFLFEEIEKPKSLLQKFVKPKGNNNMLIHAIWSPLMVLTEGRRNTRSLSGRHLPVGVRATTFEDQASNTVEVVVAKAIVQQIADTCKLISEHFERSERLAVNRLACYFKVDESNVLQLICSTSIRLQDHATGLNTSSINLSTALKSGTKKVTKKKVAQEDQKALAAATEKTRHLKISIPSMPDTATMLLQSLHHTAQRNRSPSPSKSPPKSKEGKRSISPSNSDAHDESRSLSISFSPSQPGNHPNLSPTHLTSILSPSGQSKGAGSKRNTELPKVGPLSLSSNMSPLKKAGGKEFDLPPPGADPKVIFVAAGTPLPQSPQLMRYQHLLPSSATNLEVSRRQRELHVTEGEVRKEWETFLLNQSRALAVLTQRHGDAQASKNAEEQSASIEAALKKRQAIPVPQTAHQTIFNATTQEMIDKDCRLTQQQQEGAGMVGREPQLDDKNKFMAKVKEMMAKKTLLSNAKRVGSNVSEGGSEAEDGRQMPGDSGADIYYAPNKVPKSVLLPPKFTTKIAQGATSNNRLCAHSQPKESTAHDGQTSATFQQSFQQHRKRQQDSDLAGSRGPKQDASGLRPLQLPSMNASMSATTTPSRSLTPAPKVSGAVNEVPRPESAHGRDTAPPSPANSLKPKGSLRHSIPAKTPTDVESVRLYDNLLNRRSKVNRQLDECSGLTAAEAARLEARVDEECQAFRRYTQELVYAVYCFFLENGRKAAYVEVPARFERFISAENLALVFHMLQPMVLPRARYLSEKKPNWIHSAVQYRQWLIETLHVGALAEWMPSDEVEDIENAEEATPQYHSERRTSRFPTSPGVRSPSLSSAVLSPAVLSPTSVLPPSGAIRQGGGKVPASFTPPSNFELAANYRAVLDRSKSCFVIPPLENRYEILKHEYSEGIAEVEAYLQAPNGLFYYETKRALYVDILAESDIEKSRAAQARFAKSDQDAANAASPSAPPLLQPLIEELLQAEHSLEWKLPSSAASQASGSPGAAPAQNPGTVTPSPESAKKMSVSSLGSSMMRSRRPTDDEIYCNRCKTCKVCCVCSMVYGKKR